MRDGKSVRLYAWSNQIYHEEDRTAFRPTRMKRFYLAVPLDRENLTLKKIGELGAVQLTREVPMERTEKSQTAEAYNKFMQMCKRLDSALAGISSRRREKNSLLKTFSSARSGGQSRS